MLLGLQYTFTGPNYKTYTAGDVLGASIVLTNIIDSTVVSGTVATNPATPVSNKPYSNIANITPNKHGVVSVKWVLSNNTYGFYGLKFVSESDLIGDVAKKLNVTEQEAEQVIIKQYSIVKGSLNTLGISYESLTGHSALFFEAHFCQFIYDTEIGIPSGDFQQIRQIKTDGEVGAFDANADLMEEIGTPLENFLSALSPLLAADTSSIEMFSLNGIRRQEAIDTVTKDGTTYPVALETYIETGLLEGE